MAVPSLEGLPTELKIQILWQVPVVGDLKSLVISSPGYHQSYLSVRRELLEWHLERRYGEDLDLAEALTAVRSKGVRFANKRESAITLLDDWRRKDEIRQISHLSRSRSDKANGLDEVIELLHFHKRLSFFLNDYVTNAPKPPHIPIDQWETEYIPLDLTLLERRRILRALCRLQIMKNIFGDQVYCFQHLDCDTCKETAIWQFGERTGMMQDIKEFAYRLFYGAMAPWEYEEMGSTFAYLKARVETVFAEIARDLRQLSKDTPCKSFHDILPEEERPPRYCEVDDEADLVHFDNHFDGMAGLGPNFLYSIMHMDPLTRRNAVLQNKRGFWSGPFIGLDIGIQMDYRFPLTELADRYDHPGFESFWSTLPPIEQPTTGWKAAWIVPHGEDDDIEDSLDYSRQAETDWDWCYALWDEGRLKEWKAPILVEGYGEAREEARETEREEARRDPPQPIILMPYR